MKELRDAGDEAARVIIAHQQEGIDVPPNMRQDFQNLLRLVSQPAGRCRCAVPLVNMCLRHVDMSCIDLFIDWCVLLTRR